MTQAQATTRAQTILRDTASALNPRPTLEVNELLTVTDMRVADIPNADHREAPRKPLPSGMGRNGSALTCMHAILTGVSGIL